jgi:cell division transport system permease protein
MSVGRIRLLGSEAWASIRQNVSTTAAATLTVLFAMLLLGCVIALGTWVLSWSNHLQDQLQVRVFFCSTTLDEHCTVTRAQELAVGAQLRGTQHVKTVSFVSKEKAFKQAVAQWKAQYGTNLKNLGLSNPEPDALVITATEPKYTPILGEQFCRANLTGVPSCPAAGSKYLGDSGGVHWQRAITKTVLTVAKVISIIFLVAAILLAVVSTFLIANTIRLSIFARRREIEVMKLVGATNWFIRGPFMLEGLICGVVGSILAVILLGIGKLVMSSSSVGHYLSEGSSDVHAMSFTLNALVLLFAGLLLGAVGSGLTIRRFLQV